jgi:D-glycero-alpha-D-manno-heptose 1-phosphate guanylyltransferase
VTLQAVILAGGLGTRLRPVVGDTPKAMAPVAGRPFLEHVLADLAASGVRRAVLAVGYRREVISAHFGAEFRGVSLDYSEEEEPLGTGGAVRRALRLAAPGPCLVLNGDTWLDLDHVAMVRAHVQAAAALTIAVRAVPDVARYGALEIHGGRVRAFREKAPSGPGFINAGVYVLGADLFEGVSLPAAFSLERDVFVPRVRELAPLAFEATGRFIDIGVPEDFERAQRLLAGRGPVRG